MVAKGPEARARRRLARAFAHKHSWFARHAGYDGYNVNNVRLPKAKSDDDASRPGPRWFYRECHVCGSRRLRDHYGTDHAKQFDAPIEWRCAAGCGEERGLCEVCMRGEAAGGYSREDLPLVWDADHAYGCDCPEFTWARSSLASPARAQDRMLTSPREWQICTARIAVAVQRTTTAPRLLRPLLARLRSIGNGTNPDVHLLYRHLDAAQLAGRVGPNSWSSLDAPVNPQECLIRLASLAVRQATVYWHKRHDSTRYLPAGPALNARLSEDFARRCWITAGAHALTALGIQGVGAQVVRSYFVARGLLRPDPEVVAAMTAAMAADSIAAAKDIGARHLNRCGAKLRIAPRAERTEED